MKDLTNRFYSFFWFFVDAIATKSKIISNIYYKSFSSCYINEIKKFNLLKHKKILHIGCGPFPITSIKYAEITGAEILGVDKNDFAINIAKKYVEKQKLENQIKIKKIDGNEVNPKNFDLIIISGCTFDKYNVIDNIIRHTKIHGSILIRQNKINIEKIKAFLKNYNEISVEDEIVCKNNNSEPWASLYLVKK